MRDFFEALFIVGLGFVFCGVVHGLVLVWFLK